MINSHQETETIQEAEAGNRGAERLSEAPARVGQARVRGALKGIGEGTRREQCGKIGNEGNEASAGLSPMSRSGRTQASGRGSNPA
jgi:hypothetical protein